MPPPPPPPNNTPTVPIRIDPSLWARFGELAGERNRAPVIRDLIRWWMREPGAKLPKRPDPAGHDAES